MPATLVSLGFEWRIDGDDNRNAQVAVSYPQEGRAGLEGGPPLLRIGNERINENALHYVTPNGFAGSIFDLEPGNRLRMPVRDVGPRRRRWRAEQIVVGSHARRTDARSRRQGLSRLSTGLQRAEQEPAFTGLLAAYYTGSSHSGQLQHLSASSPAGRHDPGSRRPLQRRPHRYGGGLGTVSSGTYFLTQSGTPKDRS